jgi:hypothetical protein
MIYIIFNLNKISTYKMLKSSNTEVIEKKVDIESAIARMRRPLDLTSVNLEVYGVYSLPDVWKQKISVRIISSFL